MQQFWGSKLDSCVVGAPLRQLCEPAQQNTRYGVWEQTLGTEQTTSQQLPCFAEYSEALDFHFIADLALPDAALYLMCGCVWRLYLKQERCSPAQGRAYDSPKDVPSSNPNGSELHRSPPHQRDPLRGIPPEPLRPSGGDGCISCVVMQSLFMPGCPCRSVICLQSKSPGAQARLAQEVRESSRD